MIQRLTWPLMLLLRYYRRLGLRVTLYALLSLVVALASSAIDQMIGAETKDFLQFDAVIPVLTILASSMLAVSTFSLNVMVSSHRAAAATTTPRVHRILLEDTTTQSVLAVFIGAFVYSLSSIVLYQSGFYSDGSAVFVMGVTIGVIVMIILAMLRWIDHLSNLGSVDDSIAKTVMRMRETLDRHAKAPAFGANPLSEATVLPDVTTPLRAPRSGYLQLIDVMGLEDCLPQHSFIYVLHTPGAHVLAGDVVALVSGAVAQGVLDDLQGAFVFGDQRTFEQDAEFGLLVMSEIASKALSPGINDSGTAVQAILELKSALWEYAQSRSEQGNPDAPRVFVRVIDMQSLFDAAFAQVSRDGADKIEVALCLRQALQALAATQNPQIRQAILSTAERAMDDARDAGLPDKDLERLSKIEIV